jgi:hypothetical protein
MPRARTLATAALLLAATACNGSGETSTTTTAAVPGTTTTAVTTTTSGVTSAITAPVGPNMKPDEVAVRNLLDVFAYEYAMALEASDPDRTTLLTTMASPYKEFIVDGLARDRAEGTYLRRPQGGVPPHRTNEVIFSDGTNAKAFECMVDDRFAYKRGVDQPTDTEVVRRSFQTSVVRSADGQWRITNKESQTNDTTVGRCRGL